MIINLARDFSLIVWIITALGASVATGSTVGVLASTRMRTYQLVSWILTGAVITWLMSAFIGGAVARFLLEALLQHQYWIFGMVAGVLTLLTSFCLVRLGQTHRALRWSVLGALAAWFTGAIGGIMAYDKLNQAMPSLPNGFWGSLMLSMFITTILGAFLGGMIFRHRQIWRQFP
jgi:hypothetical protein